jgi:UDP-glucose 4-epimerase
MDLPKGKNPFENLAGLMKTVVFGGAGFLGSHVADALTAAGHEVTVFDVQPSPYIQPSQWFMQGDILDPVAVQNAMRGAETVYHFAGLSDIDDAAARPLDTIKLNILGTAVIASAAAAAGVRRFVLASTVYVYSHLGGFYRCSKQAAELYIEEFSRTCGLHYTVLQYGSLYGPRAGDRNGIYTCLRQALSEQRIIYLGSGEEVREYIHVKDAARLSVECLLPEYEDQHVVITGPRPVKAKELLQMINEMVGRAVAVEFKPPQTPYHYEETPYSYKPKAGRKLDGRSYVNMKQGLLECFHLLDGELRKGAAGQRRRDSR